MKKKRKFKNEMAARCTYYYVLGAMTAALACILDAELPADSKTGVIRQCVVAIALKATKCGLSDLPKDVLKDACELAVANLFNEEEKDAARAFINLAQLWD